MVLDGSEESARRLHSMLHWDVNNGIARRSWARNSGAMTAARRAMEQEERLQITLPHLADDELIGRAMEQATSKTEN